MHTCRKVQSPLPIANRVRWQVVAVAVVGFFALASFARSPQPTKLVAASKPETKLETPVAPAKPEIPSQPSPQLSPEDVARTQMQALSAEGRVEKRIEHCYSFASPGNRAHTGPLPRFSAMVQSPMYQAILNAKHFLVGRATLQGDEAYLLVTAVDAQGQLTLFRFFLSKQKDAPGANCWMTDAVIRVGVANPDDAKKPAETPTI